jgi:hypothetical protein
MITTKKSIAAAFTKWEEDSRKHPEQFMDDSGRKSTKPKTFGELCAETLCRYLRKK